MTTWENQVYFNHQAKTYGNAIKINRWYLRAVIFMIALLPLGTSWLFLTIPKIKDFRVRY